MPIYEIQFRLRMWQTLLARLLRVFEAKEKFMTIKIYGDPGSGSLRRVTTAAQVMGIEIEHVMVDLFKGESQTAEFKSNFNPHGLTPVLVDGEVILYEAAAINLYLANKANSSLVGTTSEERFEVLQWMFWSGEQWRVFATALFDERVGKTVMGLQKNETIIEFAEGKLRVAAKVLDQHLEGRKFIVGQTLTLADIDIAGPFSQIDRSRPPLREFPNLMAWHDNLLQSVPAWAETKRVVDHRIDSFLSSVGVTL
ncbi:glutathione S-transferase family protein [Agrobacterium larrymoorei]|uniref:Glutathione S-transferase family protein n=2 Tax=Agrobacterium larrymoorei TaxID=160699 RepID=A0AAF0HEE1_9HYPH|nr:glutathione S-transferase family protein [Agrobacterium larrymoorei]WHA43100.1 glutathione S-transferase family protein [Agrobacterium larrymoorei]